MEEMLELPEPWPESKGGEKGNFTPGNVEKWLRGTALAVFADKRTPKQNSEKVDNIEAWFKDHPKAEDDCDFGKALKSLVSRRTVDDEEEVANYSKWKTGGSDWVAKRKAHQLQYHGANPTAVKLTYQEEHAEQQRLERFGADFVDD